MLAPPGSTGGVPEFTGHNVAEWLGDATDIVHEMLTQRGYQYGSCRAKWRPPCRCGCPTGCVCGTVIDYLDLSDRADVQRVREVWINGVLLPEFDGNGKRNWELIDCRWLVRWNPTASCAGHPGGACGTCGDTAAHAWPSDQRIDLPLTEPCTFGIIYDIGTPIPASVRRAVQCVACTLAKECLGLPCGSPLGEAVSISQFGVNASLQSLQKSLDGQTSTYGCNALVRLLSTHPPLMPTGWTDPALCPDMPGFLFGAHRL